MEYTLTINCDNAAFSDNPRAEIAMILEYAVERIITEWNVEDHCVSLMDHNGNFVGKAKVVK